MKLNYKLIDFKVESTTKISPPTIYVKIYKKPSWQGCIVSFPGKTAQIFYKSIQKEGIPWRSFSVNKEKVTLGRLDICYIQPWNSLITEDAISKFFQLSKEINKKKNYTVKVLTTKRGDIFTVGARQRAMFFRVYSNNQGD